MLATHQDQTHLTNTMGLTHGSSSATHLPLPMAIGKFPAMGPSGEPESPEKEASDVEFSVRQLKDVVNELFTAHTALFTMRVAPHESACVARQNFCNPSKTEERRLKHRLA